MLWCGGGGDSGGGGGGDCGGGGGGGGDWLLVLGLENISKIYYVFQNKEATTKWYFSLQLQLCVCNFCSLV